MNLQHNVFRSVTPCLVAVMVLSMPVFAQSNERDILRDRIEWLSSTSDPTVDGAPIAAVLLITRLYERRGYDPAWTDPAMSSSVATSAPAQSPMLNGTAWSASSG